MPPKGESVQTYVSPEIKRKLEEWAAEEQRSISFLVAQILIDAIATREAENKSPAPGTSKGKGGGKKERS
jgi:predicted transcriptional regulator